MTKIAIIICTEKGPLEPLSLLFILTLKKFASSQHYISLYAFAPRKLFKPSRTTIKQLERLGVNYIDINLNTKYDFYPIANKPLITAYMEKNYNHDYIIFVDSDCIALDDFITEYLFSNQVSLQSVFDKHLGATNNKDTNFIFWKEIFSIVGVKDYDLNCNVFNTNENIIGYWNSGLILAHAELNFFQKWLDIFYQLFKYKDWKGHQLYFLDQISLSALIHKNQFQVNPFDKGINYPISYHHKICVENKISNLRQLKLAHHFGAFDKMLTTLKSFEENSNEKIYWLKTQMDELNLYPSNFLSSFKNNLIHYRNINLQKALYFSKKLNLRK